MIDKCGVQDPLSRQVIGAAIEVHRTLGPGLLESVYEECLCYEMTALGLSFQRQIALPVKYKQVNLDGGLRLDVVVEGVLIVELKSIEALAPIHDAQLLTYLKLSGLHRGLLLNFNVVRLKDGIKRLVL
ncbi:MAG: GxxExxY protein [Phycisphaerae bacterium]